MDNQTTVTYFLLLEFSKIWYLKVLYFFFFLIMYLATATTNLLIISAIAFDYRLHTPMYFFLMNLAMQDLGSVSVIIPKSIVNFLLNTRYISYVGCVAQVFIFVIFGSCDLYLLTVMSYDRYVAICNPLHYEKIMNWKACTNMMIAVWLCSILCGILHTSCTFLIPFCSAVVNQFFCEIPQLLKLSCYGFNRAEDGVIVASVIVGSGCITFIIVSYGMILKTVWRIPSVQGRQKAFSTCFPHLIVVFLLALTGSFAYLRPTSNSPSYLDLALTLLYSLIPPLLNPIIYSIRNKNIMSVLYKIFGL